MNRFIYPILLIMVIQFNPVLAQLDLQGHRGARGLAPENTIPSFLKAIDLGVTTIEMDVVISKDLKVVISHDHYFSSKFCLDSEGAEFSKSDQEKFIIYKMDYEEIQKFDCGSKPHPDFAEQVNEKLAKPLLSDAIKIIERHVKGKTKYLVRYNVEIKSAPSGDNLTHPEIPEFSRLVYDVLNTYLDMDRVIVQSFDFRVLTYWKENYPDIQLAALVGNKDGIDHNLAKIGFIPNVYSPNYQLLSIDEVSKLHDLGMRVIPWTVNDKKVMEDLVKMKVDGIITDYPDRAKDLGYTVEIPYGITDK